MRTSLVRMKFLKEALTTSLNENPSSCASFCAFLFTSRSAFILMSVFAIYLKYIQRIYACQVLFIPRRAASKGHGLPKFGRGSSGQLWAPASFSHKALTWHF